MRGNNTTFGYSQSKFVVQVEFFIILPIKKINLCHLVVQTNILSIIFEFLNRVNYRVLYETRTRLGKDNSSSRYFTHNANFKV